MSNGNHRMAVVIGGASGIGWATAQALAAQGDQVTVADRNADGARSRAAELGDPHTAESVDVTDEDSVQRLFEQTGLVDVVVNCAGFSNVGLITDMPVDQFRDVIDVCLTGAFIVAKHAGRHLRSGGALVSISSLNGRQPAAGMSAYCAAKAGLSMLTQVAALELGPRGIRVNAVAAGPLETIAARSIPGFKGLKDRWAEQAPLGWESADSGPVADAVLFLLSGMARAVSGEVLHVDGGYHALGAPMGGGT